MQASEMTFGIEIECTMPASVITSRGIQVGGYHRGIQVPGLPQGWTAERDASIAAGPGRRGLEIVSPILKGAEGLQQAMDVMKTIKAWGAKTNRSTGLHIHVGAGLRNQPKVLNRLVSLTARFERALYAMTGTKSREHVMYSAPIRDAYRSVANATTMTEYERVASKYHSLNLVPLWSKGTVEFRVFQGTMNIDKLALYVQVCLGLVERAFSLKRTPAWDCTDERYQDGSRLCYFMLRNLGWNPYARQGDYKYGLLIPSTLDDAKAEAKRLTAKYDGDNTRHHGALQPLTAAS